MEKVKNIDYNAIDRCLFCHICGAEKVCPHKIEIGNILRSLHFNNESRALSLLKENYCLNCSAPCQKVCLKNKDLFPLEIKNILIKTFENKEMFPLADISDVDLSTYVGGIKIENPFLLSSSIVGSNYEMCARAFKMGWAGVAYKTIALFPQHEASPRFATLKDTNNKIIGFKNIEQCSDLSLEENMEIFRRLKKDFPNKVLIASIMGRNEEEWIKLAKICEQNGADIIECNYSCPNMEKSQKLGSTIGEDKDLVYKLTKAIKQEIKIPLMVKLTPNINDMRLIAREAKKAGADSISLINTVSSILNVNIKTLIPDPNVEGTTLIGGYSGKGVKPIALRFVSELNNDKDLDHIELSGIGGIYTWKDALEFILLGASNVQITSSIMEYGYRIIFDLISGLKYFLKENHINKISEIIGKANKFVVPFKDVKWDTILYPAIDYNSCLGCGRCYISCLDGGHQAIIFDEKTNKVKIDMKKCVGCHLCRLICPNNAINVAIKRIKK